MTKRHILYTNRNILDTKRHILDTKRLRQIQTAVSSHPLKIGHIFVGTYLL